MNAPPGMLPMAGAPLYLRIGLYGYPASGKTRQGITWPAPLLVNPATEGGFNTARHPDGSFLVQPVEVGRSHAAFIRGLGGVSVKVELDQWINYLHQLAMARQCPWQTLVMGGFSDVAAMVHTQAEKENKTRSGEIDGQKAWGDVLAWYQRTLHMLFSLPLHIIIELGVKANMDKVERDKVALVEPDLSGRGGKLVLPRELDLLLYTERTDGGTFFTHFVPRASKPVAYVKNRFTGLAFQQPVQDASYDLFAQALGLRPIWECDPWHPRCQQGRWPWPTPWHV